MEVGGAKQLRLISRLLGRLRGDRKYNALDKRLSLISTGTSDSYECDDGVTNCDEYSAATYSKAATNSAATSKSCIQDDFPANIDLRYGGQYLTREQLPEFCEQLHNLVSVIRNIQSYAKVTGEYPSELERRLEQEAREVAALAAEARNARDVVARTQMQRRALREQRINLENHLTALRETEVRELESTIRLSDRKLFKSWEVLKDSSDPAAFGPLLEEIKNKQTALECLTRLIESRRSSIARSALPPPLPQPLPPPQRIIDTDESSTTGLSGVRKRHDSRRSGCKRRRKDTAKEPRSVPLSGEPSRHGPQTQGSESTSRYRVGSAGAVVITPIELTSHGSVRDIVFFTVD